ncbi:MULTISPECIES: cob(I)yrinic acid a,c-diamide adenosyltransferase [Paenibacillus]|uniref:cob(I)yrinic acid a,c-diamide adenosyltransferase n=1 Tax=Paenibacillus TaxID=44249 RepID=UPI0028D0B906|nr:cob(I)yrinic acid a,c-diamide adenosyltransferase [Paenibacillus terrigena]
MKIYTRSGDQGTTSVIGGRVPKDHIQVETYGTIDELNCFVGQAMSQLGGERFSDIRSVLLQIQHELFDCGSDLAFANPDGKSFKVQAEMTAQLEQWIDHYEQENPKLTRFILPGGSSGSASLHVCRTVCRRAERLVVKLGSVADIHTEVRHYLNRLSDLFFVLARTANVRSGVPDVEYIRSAEVFRSEP